MTGTLKDPGIGSLSPDEPILRYVDLSTTHISQAQLLTTPDWARTVIPGPKGAPLLYTGVRAGLPTAVLAFEPRRSDLPLQVAFPILLSNLTGELLGGSAAPTDAVAPGTPVNLTIPSGATGVTVTRPDGTTTRSRRERRGRRLGVVRRDRSAGHLHGHPDPLGRCVAEPVGQRRHEPEPDAALERAGHRRAVRIAAASAVPIDPNAPVRFAVDLFDVGESNIAPGSVAAIEGLGSGARIRRGRPGTAPRPTARRPATSCGCRSSCSS